jgi:hypothetical protein
MSRTLNGNLTGQAARTERNELVEFLITESERVKQAGVDCIACGKEVEARPMKAGVCYDCYRALQEVPAPPAAQLETIWDECERIQKWISDNWDAIPEVKF